MGKQRGINVRVASGVGASGYPWSLWWPGWKWEALTAEEKAAIVADQTSLMGIYQGQAGTNGTPARQGTIK